MTALVTGVSRHALADRGDDFYATPREAVDAFIRIEGDKLPREIWEPACGDGAIVLPLREAGHVVYATDLVERGCPGSVTGIDFLLPGANSGPWHAAGGIVTNPPYKLATAFVDRALDYAPYVAMLLRLAFLEGAERRRWFQHSGLARVHIASRRLPMMHRHGWEGPKTGSAVCFAWFVFERGRVDPPQIHWFDWREAAE